MRRYDLEERQRIDRVAKSAKIMAELNVRGISRPTRVLVGRVLGCRQAGVFRQIDVILRVAPKITVKWRRIESQAEDKRIISQCQIIGGAIDIIRNLVGRIDIFVGSENGPIPDDIVMNAEMLVGSSPIELHNGPAKDNGRAVIAAPTFDELGGFTPKARYGQSGHHR